MNVCRVCVVEVEGSRVLVPACSRKAEPGMVVHTDSERVRHSRKMVLEFLALGRPVAHRPTCAGGWRVRRRPEPYGRRRRPPKPASGTRPGPATTTPATARPRTRSPSRSRSTTSIYVRDYSSCILCYKCVEACGDDAQNTFAIAVAGRGFDARISTEFDVPLPDSACVYCGNCIGVCPTGALMFRSRVRDARRTAHGTSRSRR